MMSRVRDGGMKVRVQVRDEVGVMSRVRNEG